jgi:Na+-translocating ferredoxin:NAD+ oxidoreductase RnfG subunit
MNNKKIIHITLFLAIIASLSGGLLSFVNSLTAPIINENAIAAEKVTLKLLFPNTDEFSPVTDFEDETGAILAIFEAKDAGLAYKVSRMGYANPIVMMVGISNDGEIVGLEVLELADTPGYGMKVGEAPFIDSIIGKSTTDGLDLISGSTVSSTAAISAINAARTHFNKAKGIEDDGSGSVVTPPVPELGRTVLFTADEATSVAATIIEEVVNGDETTFTLESNGYSVTEGGYDDAKPNVIKVTINTVTSVIVKVEVVEMNDTKGIGDKAQHEVFLSQFVGIELEDDSAGVDIVSGVTRTSISVIRAVVTVRGK